MNNTLIAVIVGLLLVAGGGYFLLQGNTNETNDTTDTSSDDASMEASSQESFSGSLQELFTMGQDTRCTFTIDDEYVEGTGVVYVLNERMRTDYDMTVKQDGSEIEGHTIIKDDTLYSWGSHPQTGTFAMQTEFTQEDMEIVPTPEEAQQGVDLNEELEYDCSSWSVDNSVFTLPSDIEFNNMEAQMQQMMQDGLDSGGLSCSSCEQIPDPEAKEQCLTTLGCN